MFLCCQFLRSQKQLEARREKQTKGRKQTKGFSDFDIPVPLLIFIANKQGLPDSTF